MQLCQAFIFNNLILNFSDLNVVSFFYFPLSGKKKGPSNKRGAINACLNKPTNLVIQYVERCSSTQISLKTKCSYGIFMRGCYYDIS